jgi:flagellar assembly factor FliW
LTGIYENFGEVVTMKIQTSRFGTLEVSEETMFFFPSGLVGLPACQRFMVLEAGEESGYQWFQSVEEPGFALIIVDVHFLQPDFRIDVPVEGLAELDMNPHDQILTMAVVTIPSGNPDQATANLRAPLVVNVRTRKGKQVILSEANPLRFPLLQTPVGSNAGRDVLKEPATV